MVSSLVKGDKDNTVTCHIMTFRSTTDHVYNGSPIGPYFYCTFLMFRTQILSIGLNERKTTLCPHMAQWAPSAVITAAALLPTILSNGNGHKGQAGSVGGRRLSEEAKRHEV